MRAVARKLATLSTVLAIPIAIAAIFPYSAFSFKAKPEKTRPTFRAAYVRLSEQQESAALEAAKTSWQGGVALGMRRIRAELSPSSLPADPLGEVMPRRESGVAAMSTPVRYELSALPPEHAASAPAKLQPEPPAPRSPAFSKTELLRLD